mgnify:CR=1 FL=1
MDKRAEILENKIASTDRSSLFSREKSSLPGVRKIQELATDFVGLDASTSSVQTESEDIAPVANLLTISEAGSTSSRGIELPFLNSSNPLKLLNL